VKELPIDSEQWRYVAELERIESEPLVAKLYGDSFEDTGLEDLLAQRGVGRIVITGAQTDACIRSTMHGGFTRGYDVTLVADAHTTEDLSEYGAPTPTRSSRTRISIGSIKRRRGVEAEQSHGRRRVSRRRRSVMSNATVLALMCRSRGKPIVYAGLETWPEPPIDGDETATLHRFARATASDIFVEAGGLDAEALRVSVGTSSITLAVS